MINTNDTNYQNPADGNPADGNPADGAIKVDVATRYLEDDSDPEDDKFVFAYTITITNQGDTAAKLLTRHWVITHGNGKLRKSKVKV